MRNLFVSPRMDNSRFGSIVIQVGGAGMLSLAIGGLTASLLGHYLAPEYFVFLPVLGALPVFAFHLLLGMGSKFRFAHTFLIAVGGVIIAAVGIMQRMSGNPELSPPQAIAFLIGLWMIMRFYSEGPQATGWPARIRS